MFHRKHFNNLLKTMLSGKPAGASTDRFVEPCECFKLIALQC